VHADDPYGRRIVEAAKVRTITFGAGASNDVRPKRIETGIFGIRGSIVVMGREIEIASPALGEINLLNILGACAVSRPGASMRRRWLMV